MEIVSEMSDDKIKLETIRSRFVTDFIKMHWLISVIDFHTKLIDFLYFYKLMMYQSKILENRLLLYILTPNCIAICTA